jgi:hypothetical protein
MLYVVRKEWGNVTPYGAALFVQQIDVGVERTNYFGVCRLKRFVKGCCS